MHIGLTILAGVSIAVLIRNNATTKKKSLQTLNVILSPLSNPENLPISRPTPKSSNMFPNINSIQDLQRIAGTHPDTPSPLPSLLSRTFTSKKDIHSVRILQFNLLARGLSSPPKNGGFVESPVASLHFDNYRKYRLLEEILRFDPDIVTLEEMDHYDDFFQPLMSKFGYDSIFQPKLDAPTLGIWNEKMKENDKVGQVPYYSDGSGIFWKRNVYQGLESKSINYHSQDETKEWGQVGVMIRLLNTSNGKTFVVSCTHLKSKPPHEKRRTVQISQLIENILQFRVNNNEPVILAGDFNADPNNSTYNKTAETFQSAYSLFAGSEPKYTTCKIRKDSESCHTIDYIFVSDNVQVTGCLSIPEYDSLPKEKLPSWSYPSDHLSIGVDVNLWPTSAL